MKCVLIIDCDGPNPNFRPPRPKEFKTDAEYHDAAALYDVPHTIPVLAGTVLNDKDCWHHCLPDASGIAFNAEGRPIRIAAAVVRAEPLDDPCRAMVRKHLVHVASARRTTVEEQEAELARMVEFAKANQAKVNAARAPGPVPKPLPNPSKTVPAESDA
jgi:hypothetical protein